MEIYIIFCFLFFFDHKCHTASWSNVSNEVLNIYKIYEGKTSVIPLQDLSNTLNVSLGMQLLVLNKFDYVGGIMDINTYLSMEWTEELYSKSYGATAPNSSVSMSAASIWKPSLILVNSAGGNTELVQEQSQVRIYLTSGKCAWTENVNLQGTCRPNVYFYPFDIHDCIFIFTSRVYDSNEMSLLASGFRRDYFEENVSWTVKKMSAVSYIQDSKSHVKYQMRIARRSLNFVLNYILPIVILAGLNIFIFILPRSSGERAGFSMTCFLAFVVFMNTIVTSLPNSSAPVAALVYYLTVLMTISAAITVLVLLTLMIELRVDNQKKGKGKNDKICSCCTCCHLRCKPNQVQDTSTQNQPHNKPPCLLQWFVLICCCTCCKCCISAKRRNDVEWIDVVNTLDYFFFFFFLVVEIFFSIGFLSYISLQYSEVRSNNWN